MRSRLLLSGALAAVLSSQALALPPQEFKSLKAFAGSMVNSSEGKQDLTLVALSGAEIFGLCDSQLIMAVKRILKNHKLDRDSDASATDNYIEKVARDKGEAIATLKAYYPLSDALLTEAGDLFEIILKKVNYNPNAFSQANLALWFSGKVKETKAPYVSAMSANFLTSLVGDASAQKVFASLEQASEVVFVEVGYERNDGEFVSKGLMTLFQSQDGKVYALIGEIVWT